MTDFHTFMNQNPPKRLFIISVANEHIFSVAFNNGSPADFSNRSIRTFDLNLKFRK